MTQNTTPRTKVVTKAKPQRSTGAKVPEAPEAKVEQAEQAATEQLFDPVTPAISPEVPEMFETPKQDPYIALAAYYATLYPTCVEFHITSDRMVFLSHDKSLALQHQSTLRTGKLHSIKIQ